MSSLQEALRPVRTLLPHFAPKKPEVWDGSIPRPEGSELLVMFNVFLKLEPGIQVHRASSTSSSDGPSTVHRDKCTDVRLHADSLLHNWSVKHVNVVQGDKSFVRVYVAFEQDASRPGLNFWGDGAYGRMLRQLLSRVWSTGQLHWNPNRACVSLFGKSDSSIPGYTIAFK